MNSHRQQHDIQELLIRFLENDLNDSQRIQLLAWSRSNSKAVQEYCDFIKDYAIIAGVVASQVEAKYGYSYDTQFDQALWAALREDQDKAPGLEIHRETPPRELVRKVVYPPKVKKKLNKFTIFTLINSAAILLFFFLLKYVAIDTAVEVATLTDSMNAKWADIDSSMQKGARLVSNRDILMLREGLVELTFDNHSKAVIEAPAEFQVLAEDRIALNYGKIYMIVPKEAIGFSVYTQNAKIIDLGTEFGVQTDVFGDVCLHVIKGKTALLAGGKSNKVNLEVIEGQAKEVSATTQAVSDIPCKTELFVREISSEHNFIWRGQNEIDLADIVGGGSGFGTGKQNIGMSPVTGKMADLSFLHSWEANRKADNTYHRVNTNPFIDGVFVPNGLSNQIISSLGHVFSECPVTGGNYFVDISNTPKSILRSEIVLGGVNYSRGKSSALFLHANLGITYDLNAIRSQLPAVQIVRFRSVTGVCDSVGRPCNADFWVLVDGQLRYSREKVQQAGVCDFIDIELPPNARFLTLIATDGGDPEAGTYMGKTVTSIDSDWCLFAQPVLVLE
jgi:hypothetical protein